MAKRFYITTPIYYPSAKLHIGHAYCTVLTDTLARYNRMIGKEVYFLTGSDEHGQKIEENAKKAGKTPQQFVDDIVQGFYRLWEKLEITNDQFIRTTNPPHMATVQKYFHIYLKRAISILVTTKDGIAPRVNLFGLIPKWVRFTYVLIVDALFNAQVKNPISLKPKTMSMIS